MSSIYARRTYCSLWRDEFKIGATAFRLYVSGVNKHQWSWYNVYCCSGGREGARGLALPRRPDETACYYYSYEYFSPRARGDVDIYVYKFCGYLMHCTGAYTCICTRFTFELLRILVYYIVAATIFRKPGNYPPRRLLLLLFSRISLNFRTENAIWNTYRRSLERLETHTHTRNEFFFNVILKRRLHPRA